MRRLGFLCQTMLMSVLLTMGGMKLEMESLATQALFDYTQAAKVSTSID